MKTIITTILIILAAISVYAQDNTVNYGYDSAGNRTSRVPNPSSSNPAVGSETQQELLAQVISILGQNSQEEDNQENEKAKEAPIQISVYPNPATDKITLNKESNNESLYTQTPIILLLDATGKIMDKRVTNDAVFTFDINHLADGLYYVYYINDDDRNAWKVVKE